MPGNSLGAERISQLLCPHQGMHENGRLSDTGILEIFRTAFKHYPGKVITQHLVSFGKQGLR